MIRKMYAIYEIFVMTVGKIVQKWNNEIFGG